ncbi:MAG: rhomboid family intramembrane serine protease [Vicingaceae bacterium]
MSNPFINDFKNLYQSGSILIKLLFINVGVFLLINIINVFFWLFSGINYSPVIDLLSVPAHLNKLLFKPWTIVTYMFTHVQFFHLLFNMLVLYFSGRLFLDFIGNKKLLNVYILGGVTGALFFILAYNIFPVFSTVKPFATAIGASASVMAVLIAISTFMPNFIVRLFLLGNIQLKYLALIYIVIDLLSIPGSNSGGHIAHLGGALFGFLYGFQLKKGIDITNFFSNILDKISKLFASKSKMKVVYSKKVPKDDYEYNAQKAAMQKEIDRILDKIAKSGYDGLTQKEKDILNRASRK